MRLTVELLQNSPSWLNALKERELDLRGTCRKEQILHF
jgi:U2 small nuclear ribonucleoprotein A'